MTTSATLIAGLLAAVSPAPDAADAQVWRLHEDHVLGTSLDLVIVGGSQASAMMAATASRQEIDRLDAIVSGWRADSELSRLNRDRSAIVSPELFAVVTEAEAWRARTDGAYDGRLGLIRASLESGAEGRAATGAVALDPASRRITLSGDASLDLDGFAKGWIVDRALAAAQRAAPDVRGLMIDIGGDVRCSGEAPGGAAWRIGVADPSALADNAAPAEILALNAGAVAFSGRGERALVAGLGHHINPATGALCTETAGVCVVAPTAAQADALSTAFAAIPAEKAVAMADRTPGVETLVFTADGGRLQSAGFQRLVDVRGAGEARLERIADGGAWPQGYELTIGYEIPKIAVGNYRSPYVVVWITDEAKNLVRVVTLLGGDAKYVPDNYVFWRRYGRKTPGVESVARPTRAPGRYSLVWDGRDQAGRPVPQGRYTIHVEAVREHGGHSYLATDLDLGASATTAQIAGKEELGGVTIRYGKRK